MAHRHLTDYELQEYLDGHRSGPDAFVESHLPSCDICARRLQQYRSLFSSLNTEPEFRLPKDFAEKVAASAAGAPQERTLAAALRKLIPVVSVAVAVCTALWFLDSSDVIRAIANIARVRLSLDWNFFDILLARIHNSSESFMILTAGVLALAAIWIIDTQIRRTRRNTLTMSI